MNITDLAVPGGGRGERRGAAARAQQFAAALYGVQPQHHPASPQPDQRERVRY